MNEEQMIEECRTDFGTFLTMDLALKKGDNYKPLAPFHYLVAKALQDFYDVLKTGGSPRLILSVPPRQMKSTICSIEFPAWILGREPDWTVNIATKDADLSTTFGGETKDTVSSDFYKMVFPDRNIRSDTKSKSDWAFETGGRYSISSVQAPPKGKGFNCLRGDTEITTNNGIKTIKDLYLSELQFGLKVLSYNHDKNTFEWKRIVATKRSTNITGKLTFGGKELFVTPLHRIWTREAGYTESQSTTGLSGLSLKPSQIGTQTEAPKLNFIFDPSQEAEYVYDIEVEDNHNFFANGLLVHNCIIIDDPYPGYVQAQSPAIQDMVWNTFKSDYEDRRSPNGTGIIIIMQRLGLNDLVAKIEEREEKLEEQGAVYHKYKKIIFPAIAEEDEYLTENGVKKVSELADLSGLDLFRKAGETLWEEGAPKKEILAMIGDDPVAFSSQYQQNPILSETQTYQANMVHFYDEDDKDIDFSKAKHYTFLDPSASKRKEADNSAIITIAVLDNKVYVRECFTAKFNSKVILQELFRQILKYDSKHGVEAQASQVLWSTLIRDYAIENQIKVRHNEDNEYRVHTQKEARIRTHLDNYILNGRLYLKKHMTSLLREICDFPRGRRDDQIDALAAAVSMIESKKTTKETQTKKISRQALSMISGMR